MAKGLISKGVVWILKRCSWNNNYMNTNFDVLLTVHLSIFILVFN